MSLGMASVADLEKRLEELRRELVCIGEMRRGSLTKRYRQCGKPNCHCAQPGDPGHGPSFSLTRQVDGKTVTRIIPAGEAVERTQTQIAEYQRFRGLTRELIEVSERLCQARLKRGEEPVPKTAQKKLPKELPTGSRTRSRETDRRCGRRATGSGSPGAYAVPTRSWLFARADSADVSRISGNGEHTEKELSGNPLSLFCRAPTEPFDPYRPRS